MSEETRAFSTGATRDADTGKLDYEGFLSPLVLRAYAEYMHRCRTRNIPVGQTLRSSDNWQNGIPQDAYAKSLIRHTMEFWLLNDGFEARDEKGNSLSLEDVCCAILFNVSGYLFEALKHGAAVVSLPPGVSNEKFIAPPEIGAEQHSAAQCRHSTCSHSRTEGSAQAG